MLTSILPKRVGNGSVPPSSAPFATSWAASPFFLGCIRLLQCLYVFVTIIYSFIYFSEHTTVTILTDFALPVVSVPRGSNAIGHSFSYFTYLSFWGLGFYHLVAAIHSFYYSRHGRTLLDHPRCPTILSTLHSLFYSSVTTYPLFVTLVYWISMYPHGYSFGDVFTTWGMTSVHGLNSLFGITEIVLPLTSPAPALHLPLLMAILSVYLGLAYLTRLTGGFYVYLWMDPQFGWQQIVAHVAGYGGLFIIIFICVQVVIWARNYLVVKCGYRADKDSPPATIV